MKSNDDFLVKFHEMSGISRAFHKPDRPWRKAFQPEAVVIYCEG